MLYKEMFMMMEPRTAKLY